MLAVGISESTKLVDQPLAFRSRSRVKNRQNDNLSAMNILRKKR
jgi:hypothetical protein